jgi:hypothetical protein
MIEFITGPVEVGWSDFTVRLSSSGWTCHTSYICSHPLRDLIFTAIDIYDHIFGNPVPEENAVWDTIACDELGGIVIRTIPLEKQVRVSVFNYTGDASLWSKPENLPDMLPVGEATIDYWEFADAVFMDAARSIVRHGFTGFRERWEPHRWDIDAHFEVIPIEHFLFLAALVQRRQPSYGMTFQEELEILNEINNRLQR